MQNHAVVTGGISSRKATVTNVSFNANDLSAVYARSGIKIGSASNGNLVMMDNDFKAVEPIKVVVSPIKSTFHKSAVMKIQLVGVNKNIVENLCLELLVKNYDTYETFYKYSDSNGIVKFNTYDLPAGTFTIRIRNLVTDLVEMDWDDQFIYWPVKMTTSKITIAKAKTVVKATKVTAKYKKSKYFKITVKNKLNKKLVPELKLKVKVYTGKKFKTYVLKTNKKGVAKLNTKKLKKGSHKIVVGSGEGNYIVSKVSSIRIK